MLFWRLGQYCIRPFNFWSTFKIYVAFPKGDYVIVDPIEEGEKVKAEISVILYKDHIQYLQKQRLWWVKTNIRPNQQFCFSTGINCVMIFTLTSSRPEGFMEESSGQDKTNKQQEKEEGSEEKDEDEDVSDSEDDESDLFVNTNRINYQYSESEEEEEDSEEEDDDVEEKTENGS